MAAVVLVGFFVWLFAVALGDDDVEGRSPDVAFAPIPGFVLVEAPPAVIAPFREIMKAKAPGIDFSQMFAGIDGRGVERDGDVVAVAVVFSLNSELAEMDDDNGFAEGFSRGFAASWGPEATSETVTVAGANAVILENDGRRAIASYKDGLAIMVVAQDADRATLTLIMEGLVENVDLAAAPS